MKNSTKNKMYLTVVAGLGALSSSASFAAISDYDLDMNGFDDSTIWNAGLTNEVVEAYGAPGLDVNGNPVIGGTVRVREDQSNPSSDHITMTPKSLKGQHTVGTKKNVWFFDETGSGQIVTDGTSTNTSVYTLGSTTNTVTDGTSTTIAVQAAGGKQVLVTNGANLSANFQTDTQLLEGLTDGTNVNVVTRTSTSLFDSLTDGVANANTSSRTATTQVDQVANAGGNASTTARTATSKTDTVTDGTNTTALTQNSTDVVASSGAGPGSARVAVQRSGGAGNAAAELSVTNSAGNTHGVFVGENSTRISGGTNSTSLAFDDNGAHFRNDATGGPARVTGVADGVADFDAVNFRQLNALDGKLTKKINETGAVAAAFAQLGQAQTPGKSTFGIAGGGQGGKSALAIGFSHRPISMKPVVIKASIGAAGSTTSGGIGATWEF
jgi:hypothetical protein